MALASKPCTGRTARCSRLRLRVRANAAPGPAPEQPESRRALLSAAASALGLAVAATPARAADDASNEASSRMSYSRFLVSAWLLMRHGRA